MCILCYVILVVCALLFMYCVIVECDVNLVKDVFCIDVWV